MGMIENLSIGLRITRQLPRFLPNASWGPDRVLDANADLIPDMPALAYLDERHSWAEVRRRSDQWAHFFQSQGVVRGDRVVLLMDNRPDFLFAFHGLSRLGAVSALINTHLVGAPLAHALKVSAARKLCVGSEHVAKLQPVLPEVSEIDREKDLWIHLNGEVDETGGGRVVNDEVSSAPQTRLPCLLAASREVCTYIYTSGTTGFPKAAIVSNQRIVVPGAGFGLLMFRVSPGELIYVPLPLYHSSAMFVGWGSALATGAGIALRRKFSASNFVSDLRHFDAKAFVYIGELCRYLLNSPVQEGERDHSVRCAVGNGLRPDIWEPFTERFGIPIMREFYGATEGTTSFMNVAGRPGMVGKKTFGQLVLRCDLESGDVTRNAQGLCEPVEVGETGLLVGAISKVIAFDGYVDEKETAKKIIRDVKKRGDRWFNTGDLLRQHEGGWLSFEDRVGDTFRWKGENVSTNEVAEVLNGAAGILESNVYGVQVTGTDGRAGMASLSVGSGFELDEFASFVVAQLPNYQRPLFVRILSGEVSVTGTFKHKKVTARDERFDPSLVSDALYYLEGDQYQPLDQAAFDAIESGEILPG